MDNEDNEEFGNKEDTKNEGDESELKVDDDDEDLFGDKENDAPSTENNNADASVEETKTESRNQEKEDNLDDLFGSDLDKEEEEKNTEQANETEAPTYGQEEEEEKVEKEPGPPEELEYYPLPKIQKNAELFYVRLPNTLSLEPRPFNPATYEEMKPSEQVDEEGRRTFVNPETAIRWRYVADENGEMKKKESNARFVRWSDGSLQLMVGNEVYDVVQQEISQDHPNFLFVRQHQFIKCHGRLNHKLIVRPTNIASSKAHQRLTASVVQRHKREKKIKIVVTEADPELDKQKKEQAEDQKIKASLRLEGAKTRKKNKYGELTPEFLEEGNYDEDGFEEEDDRTSRRKKRRMSEEEAERRLSRAKEPSSRYKKSKNSYSDDDDGSDY